MRISSVFRAGLIALMAMVGASVSSVAHADSGTIRISVVKGGWFIGASGGSGTLTFHGSLPWRTGHRGSSACCCSFKPARLPDGGVGV